MPSGGVIVSYFEWLQGLQQKSWPEAEVLRKLLNILDDAFDTISARAQRENVSMRTAALSISVEKVGLSNGSAGFFPDPQPLAWVGEKISEYRLREVEIVTHGVFELFKIGVGPSSSHTMGPMSAAADFVEWLAGELLAATARVRVWLYGSLALTGKGHATDRAILVGLAGYRPDLINPDAAEAIIGRARREKRLMLDGSHMIDFDEARDTSYLQRERLPFHSNCMRCAAFTVDGRELMSRVYYSIGGGAIVDEEAVAVSVTPARLIDLPYPFASAAELLTMADVAGVSIAALMFANELVRD